MRVEQFLGRDIDAIERAVRCIALAIKEQNEIAYEGFLNRDIQIGMFYYSDQFTVGPITFEMLKDGYDEKYHSFAVKYAPPNIGFYRIVFQKIRPAFDEFVRIYLEVYSDG